MKMMGALGRDRVYLYIYRNLSGDPLLDGHDAEINARITQIHELLRVRDGLDRMCEFTESEAGEFLIHISIYDVWCAWSHGGVAVLLPGFCCLHKNRKTGLRRGRSPMCWPIS